MILVEGFLFSPIETQCIRSQGHAVMYQYYVLPSLGQVGIAVIIYPATGQVNGISLLQANIAYGPESVFLLVIDRYIAPKIGPLVFKLYLLVVLAKNGGPGIFLLVLGKGTPVNNVNLFAVRWVLLSLAVTQEHKGK